ncbi:ABC transporter permease [Actinomadura sp. LOL_016]|uniref:ABC transporter permease n=1 Tax=unclassified Actinomadura TaxID=2626254 RepID=UPI003A806851
MSPSTDGGGAAAAGAEGRLPRWAPGVISVLAVLALFELLVRSGALPERYFPPMTEVLARLGAEIVTVSFWSDVARTLQGWALGLLLALVTAVPAGLVIGRTPLLRRGLRPVIEFLRPVPSVALIPAAILLFGTGTETKVFLIYYAAFWPLLMQTLYGMLDVDPVPLDTARSFGVGRARRLLLVSLPSAVPYIATGARIASAVALVLAVTAELVIGSPGLGQTINVAREGNALPLMYALIVTTGLLGWALNLGFHAVERRLLRWHPSHREVTA